jgi:hypothetical protein
VNIVAALALLLSVRIFEDFVLMPHRAGIVRAGESIDTLYWREPKIDAELIDLKTEGSFTPVLKVTVEGKRDALRAYIAAGDGQFIVRGIDVRDPRLRTQAGIHVGSTLGELRKAYGKRFKLSSDGTSAVRVDSLSMTFRLGGDVYDNPRHRVHNFSDLPDDVPIVSIWVN